MPKRIYGLKKSKNESVEEKEETDLCFFLKSIDDPKVSSLIDEYCRLSQKSGCSELDDDRLQEILDQACEDRYLNFWLLEANHILGHRQNCLDDECRDSYDESKSVLRKEFQRLKQDIGSSLDGFGCEKRVIDYLQFRENVLAKRAGDKKPVEGKRK